MTQYHTTTLLGPEGPITCVINDQRLSLLLTWAFLVKEKNKKKVRATKFLCPFHYVFWCFTNTSINETVQKSKAGLFGFFFSLFCCLFHYEIFLFPSLSLSLTLLFHIATYFLFSGLDVVIHTWTGAKRVYTCSRLTEKNKTEQQRKKKSYPSIIYSLLSFSLSLSVSVCLCFSTPTTYLL